MLEDSQLYFDSEGIYIWKRVNNILYKKYIVKYTKLLE